MASVLFEDAPAALRSSDSPASPASRPVVADGPGWYESSRELLMGLAVLEWSQAEATQLDCIWA